MCSFLRCGPNKDQITEAVSKWDSEELDEAAADAGLVFAIVRTPEEWAAHPQGKQLADTPLVEIIKIGDSDPKPFTPAPRPLSGLRVLAATHVIAGNVMARTLAEHGAEVLQLAHPQEFENEGLMQDPCAGFTSSAWLILSNPRASKGPTNCRPTPMYSWKATRVWRGPGGAGIVALLGFLRYGAANARRGWRLRAVITAAIR